MSASRSHWTVEMPSRGTASSRAERHARLSVSDGEDEVLIDLPQAVGRVLEAQGRDGSLDALSMAELLAHVDELLWRCARERVAALLDRREYSAAEVRSRLVRDGYDASICNEVVRRAVESGLIDDARYADALIRARLAGGWGRMRIERDLVARGIDSAAVEGWPDAYCGDDADEEERALAVARTRRLATTRAYEKLVRYLCGRGFSLPLSMRVARKVVDEATAD